MQFVKRSDIFGTSGNVHLGDRTVRMKLTRHLRVYLANQAVLNNGNTKPPSLATI